MEETSVFTQLDSNSASTLSVANQSASELRLPSNYLSAGYYAATENGSKYLRPAFVGLYAEQIATALSSMKVSDFVSLIKLLKKARRSTLPFEARLTAVSELYPRSVMLVSRKKAPSVLIDFVTATKSAVHNDDDFLALLRHMEAISAFMMIGGDA